MAKVTITLDDEGDDDVTVKLDIDPPMRSAENETNAHTIAAYVMEAIQKATSK